MKITEKNVNALLKTLNTIMGNPTKPYVDGKAQIGCLVLDNLPEWGGYAAEQIMNESGATRHFITAERFDLEQLSDRLLAFIDGFEAANGRRPYDMNKAEHY